MAYQLADLRRYVAESMTGHPEVPFYFMNWLALAVTGYPVAMPRQGFFRTVLDHLEEYHKMPVYIAAFVGGAGVYLSARIVLLTIGVVVVALLIWLVSTPTTSIAVSPAEAPQ